MSITIALQLRSLAEQVNLLAGRANKADQTSLRKIAAELIEIAEQLERDARD